MPEDRSVGGVVVRHHTQRVSPIGTVETLGRILSHCQRSRPRAGRAQPPRRPTARPGPAGPPAPGRRGPTGRVRTCRTGPCGPGSRPPPAGRPRRPRPAARGRATRKSAIPSRIRLLSKVRAGSSFSGSVCMTRWRTSCSTIDRWANMMPALHHLLEAPGTLHPLVEAGEELEGGPGHDGVDQLVPPPGERPVDGGPGHLGLPGRVLDGGLGQPPSGHAGVGRLQDPLASVVHRRGPGSSEPEQGLDARWSDRAGRRPPARPTPPRP